MVDSTEILKVPCEIYSRIVGYMRPIRDWNTGKRQEFSERKSYIIPMLKEANGDGGSVRSVQ
jgi:hypothetical protein